MYENICISCFHDLRGQQICPHCGNVESGIRKRSILPARFLLHGRYLIGEVLSSDKNGMCYKSLDTQENRIVEIQEYFPREHTLRDKTTPAILPLSQDQAAWMSKSVHSILNNAKTMMQFADCGAVLHIFDAFEDNNTVYIVNEYLEGMTLEEYLKQCGGALDADTALSIVYPILDALAAMHKMDLVHRAVTPKNIILTTDNSVKLINFVFLKEASAYKESEMTIYFSPGYAPYEQYVSRERRGPYSDIYSVGAVLFRMLVGQTPPDAVGRKNEDTLRAILDQTGIPQYLKLCICKAMDMNKDVRFKSASDFKKALRQETELVDIDSIIDQKNRVKQIAIYALIALLGVVIVVLLFGIFKK